MERAKMDIIHASVPVEMKAQTERLADQKMTSVASIVRQALAVFLARNLTDSNRKPEASND